MITRVILPMLLQNNKYISIDIIRRSGIGIMLGILLVIPLSFIIGNSQTINHDITFDSEVIEIPKSKHENDEGKAGVSQQDSDEARSTIISDLSKNYKFFNANHVGLTETQIVSIDNGQPTLSLIISGVSGQKSLVDHIVKTLPQDVTIAVSPYLKNSQDILDTFHSHGFEIWMDMATITLDMNHDSGGLALNPTYDFESNIDFLTQQIGNKDYITGVALPQRSLIIESSRLWQMIVDDLYAQGYGIIDNTRQVTKPSLYFFRDNKAPYIKTDHAFEQSLSFETLKNLLAQARQKLMEKNSSVITIPVFSPSQVDLIAQWLELLKQDDNVVIIPASAQVQL